MSKFNKGTYAIPIAIVVFGFIIAGAILFSSSLKDNGEKTRETTKSATEIKPIDADDDPVLGNPNASVTFVNFGDFRCQFCARFQREIKPAIMKKYVNTGKVKYVYRDFITMGDNSILAAEAANCAGEQDKYWEYADYLHKGKVGHKAEYTANSLAAIALSLKLDVSLFRKCLISGKYKKEIEKDTMDAAANGATGTPTVFVNGRIIDGLRPLEEYEKIIEEELLQK